MRYVKAALLALCFFVSMLFFVQNNAPLSTSLVLELDAVVFRVSSVPLPVYLLVLAAFLAGAFASIAFLLIDRIRMLLELRTCRAQKAKLEEEVQALRNLPLNQPLNQPQAGFAAPEAGV